MRFNKAILLAGGTGTRLKPMTNMINKHLLPVFDKPMIFYSMSILMLAKIRDICIVTNKENIGSFKNFFKRGDWLGLKITYKIQKKSIGIGDGITLCKKFIGKSNYALCLGDNFFYGGDLTGILKNAQDTAELCKILTYEVPNPSSFGVLSKKNKKHFIYEKPKKFIGNEIVTGLYFLPNESLKINSKLKKSKRGEFEITNLLNKIFDQHKSKVYKLNRGTTWMDLGNLDSLNAASDFIKLVQNFTNKKIACLEEISINNRWIKKISKNEMQEKYGDSEYYQYLKKLNFFN
tara:strand:- start:72 stop:944 length:873 start_codon:yes stop_codon:yes gene_type:complete